MVIAPGANPPPPWAHAEQFSIDRELLDHPDRLAENVDALQHRYVQRLPTVYILGVDSAELARVEVTDAAPYELGARFSFLRERLTKVVWHNSYDARSGSLVWWWAHKAETRLGVIVDGPADVVGLDGRPFWVDGGPRQPLDTDETIVHHETVELGRSTPIPPTSSARVELAPDQLGAVAHLVGPARVIAPAGSGKTRVLTARVRHLIEDRGVEPEVMTALAYNRRAAREMVERLPRGDSLSVRTIHSIGWEILRMAKPGVRLIDESDQRRRLEPITTAPPRQNTDVIGPYVEALEEVRVGLAHPEEVEAGRDDVPGFAGTFHRYRDRLDRAGEADHGEQIYGAIEALCTLPDLRAHWEAKCRHLLVDEFQDLTPAYLLLIRLLAGPTMNVFGVGDDDQVIYGYSGADPSFLIEFSDLFPGATEHALGVNYRSPVDVVAAAVNLLGYNLRRVEKEIDAHKQEGGLEVVTAPGDDLALVTADRVESLIEGGADPDSIAVLARVNSTLLPVRIALAERDIPFDSPLSSGILDRTVLRAALSWIRIAVEPEAMARNDLFEIIRRPGRGITRVFGDMIGRRRGPFGLEDLARMGERLDGRRLTRWNGFCDDIASAAASAGSTTTDLLDVLIEEIGLDRAAAALDAGRSRADRSAQGDDLTALRRAAALGPGPADFETWLRESLSTESRPAGVLLSTIHRVKGLEWDHVLVFGADRGAMPHDLAGDVEEERRVFHVAITRGRDSVTVLADGGRPSRFLTEIDGVAPRPQAPPPREDREAGFTPADGVHVAVGDRIEVSGGYRGTVTEVLTTGALLRLETGATMAVPWGERVGKGATAGRLAPGTGEVDAGLAGRLREWRREQARSQGVPAYVVFNDRTLEALAAQRPSTSEALLAVTGIGPAKLEAYGEDLLELMAFD